MIQDLYNEAYENGVREERKRLTKWLNAHKAINRSIDIDRLLKFIGADSVQESSG